MAWVEMQKHIIHNTLTNWTDQDHFEVHHYSRSHDIVDRTKFLLWEIAQNPATWMLHTAQAMEVAAQKVSKYPVMWIPCNTFHAPAIFNEFISLLEENNIDAHVLNMIEETGKFIKEHLPNTKNVWLMSTTWTRTVGVYNEVLTPLWFSIIEVPGNIQEELHDSIYNKQRWIKAKNPVTEKARENFFRYAWLLKEAWAEAIILGCTEIPLALPEKKIWETLLVDPMVALSRALIREVDASKLLPMD